MEKKISFGFNKVSKKSNIFANKFPSKDDKNKIELIKCLESQSIQLLVNKVEEAPLIIPLKDDRKTSAALLSLRTRQAVLNGEEIPVQDEKKHSLAIASESDETNGKGIEDIEKRAARELLAEIGKEKVEDVTGSSLVLPIKVDDLPLDGAKESNMDDYDSIPISQFGKAMLRGMGWKEEPKIKNEPIDEGPMVRPKGMGLGADKALKPKPLLIPPEANEVLEIKKNAFVRVLCGKNKDLYGQIEGLDDHAGRVFVKMALGGTKESFNEFMVQPVSKKEYTQYSKCINSAKYDEYKRKENEYGQIVTKKEDIKKENDSAHEVSCHRNDEIDQKHERYKSSSRRCSEETIKVQQKTHRRSRSRDRRDDEYSRSSTSHKKYSNKRTPSRHRSRSNDSENSDSSTYRSKHKKKSSKSKKTKKSKDKKHDKRNSSEISSDDERRHKKKTKKSKRGRSRSRSKGRR